MMLKENVSAKKLEFNKSIMFRKKIWECMK